MVFCEEIAVEIASRIEIKLSVNGCDSFVGVNSFFYCVDSNDFHLSIFKLKCHCASLCISFTLNRYTFEVFMIVKVHLT